MEIVILNDGAEVAQRAADILEVYARRGGNLGLATGSTPSGTYQELVRRHREEGLSFADCRAFLLDEYVGLPPTMNRATESPSGVTSLARSTFLMARCTVSTAQRRTCRPLRRPSSVSCRRRAASTSSSWEWGRMDTSVSTSPEAPWCRGPG